MSQNNYTKSRYNQRPANINQYQNIHRKPEIKHNRDQRQNYTNQASNHSQRNTYSINHNTHQNGLDTNNHKKPYNKNLNNQNNYREKRQHENRPRQTYQNYNQWSQKEYKKPNQNTNSKSKGGPLPFYTELTNNKFALTWLKETMEGEEGENRLRKLQEEIRKEYNIEIDLETENQEGINQVKGNQKSKKGKEEEKERERIKRKEEKVDKRENRETGKIEEGITERTQRERLKEIMETKDWETEKGETPSKQRPKERRETFEEKKTQRMRENRTRATPKMHRERENRERIKRKEQEEKKEEKLRETLEKCRTQINLFQTENRIYNSMKTHRPVMEEIETMTLCETKYPFVVMKTEKNGHCGFMAIVRHFYPHLRTCHQASIEDTIKLRNLTKKYIINNWDETIEIQLGNDYPFLKRGDIKENYIKQHQNLEICHLDLIALSKILKMKFVILIIPEDAPPSITEVCHPKNPRNYTCKPYCNQVGEQNNLSTDLTTNA